MVTVNKTKLSNGLRVIHIPFMQIQSVAIVLLGRAGSMYETKGKYGSAHFLEHIVFEGTEKYPDNELLDKVIKNVGGRSNGGTGYETIDFYCKLLKEDAEKGFDYLSQILIYPLIKSKDVKKNREIIRQEYKHKLNDPVTKFNLENHKYLYPKSPRRQAPSIGLIREINRTTQDDLQDFKETHYNAANFVLSVCGNIEKKTAFELAEKYFHKLKTGRLNDLVEIPKDNKFFVRAKQKDDIKQTTLKIIYPSFDSYDKRKYAANIMGFILGGDMLSRLFQKIRAKHGLAYSVGADMEAMLTHGFFDIHIQIDEKNISKVIKITKEEIVEICTNLVSEEELNRVKKSVVASFTFGDEDCLNRAEFYADIVLFDRLDKDQYSYIKNYMKVTRDEIKSVANDIFSNNPKVFVLSKSITNSNLTKLWNEI